MVIYGRKKSSKLEKIYNGVLEIGEEFLLKTSLHGFHWLAEIKANPKGQCYYRISFIIWLITVIVCLFFALFLMGLVWQRYDISPTITTIETNNYPISNVPFPGVTICNINSVYKPHALDIVKQLKAYGISKKNATEFLSHLSALINHKEIDEEYLLIFDILIRLGYNASRLMLKLAQPCKQLLKSCFWLGKQILCSEYFRTTKTGFGYCCSFNYQALRSDLEIHNINNLDEYFQINTPLIHTTGAGEDFSLRIILDVESYNYLAPKRLFYGTEIIIHDPEEFPTKTMLTAFGLQGTDVSVAVRTSVVESENDVANLPVYLRFCRFSYEDNLVFLTVDIFSNLVIQKQTSINLSDSNHQCDCLPSCSEQNYGADTFISTRINGVGQSNTEDTVSNLSSVVVYFKDISCIKYRRELFKTWDDFLASFGGIFGLCLGGSVISLIEILYYFTFKLLEINLNFVPNANRKSNSKIPHVKSTQMNVQRIQFIP